MSASRHISNEVMRLLYAHSGNQCAYPGCCAPIFEDDGLLTGECCHIKAFSIGGPRYDAAQVDEERNGIDNLVLLCSRHHKMIDADEVIYTAAKLQKYKREHEAMFSAETLKLSEEQLIYLQRSSENFWKRIEEIDHSDTVAPDFKIMVDQDRSTADILRDVEQQLNWIDNTFEDLFEDDNTLAQRIREYLIQIGIDVTEYDKQLEMPPYTNPFFQPHWETFAYGTHNTVNELKMHYFQLVVRALERISIAEKQEHPLLQFYRERFAEYQKHSYYRD